MRGPGKHFDIQIGPISLNILTPPPLHQNWTQFGLHYKSYKIWRRRSSSTNLFWTLHFSAFHPILVLCSMVFICITNLVKPLNNCSASSIGFTTHWTSAKLILGTHRLVAISTFGKKHFFCIGLPVGQCFGIDKKQSRLPIFCYRCTLISRPFHLQNNLILSYLVLSAGQNLPILVDTWQQKNCIGVTCHTFLVDICNLKVYNINNPNIYGLDPALYWTLIYYY